MKICLIKLVCVCVFGGGVGYFKLLGKGANRLKSLWGLCAHSKAAAQALTNLVALKHSEHVRRLDILLEAFGRRRSGKGRYRSHPQSALAYSIGNSLQSLRIINYKKSLTVRYAPSSIDICGVMVGEGAQR